MAPNMVPVRLRPKKSGASLHTRGKETEKRYVFRRKGTKPVPIDVDERDLAYLMERYGTTRLELAPKIANKEKKRLSARDRKIAAIAEGIVSKLMSAGDDVVDGMHADMLSDDEELEAVEADAAVEVEVEADTPADEPEATGTEVPQPTLADAEKKTKKAKKKKKAASK